jgi:hypothetical protein
MMVSPPTPAPESAGITALPIPPAPITATFADFSLRCKTDKELRTIFTSTQFCEDVTCRHETEFWRAIAFL